MLVIGVSRYGQSRRCALAAMVLTLFGGVASATDLTFAELSLQRGVNYVLGTPFAQYGAGQGMVDLDNDGDLDLVILGATNGLVGVYENLGGGQFVSRSFSTGITPLTAPAGFSAADYDGDGDTDLFLSGWFVSNRLLRNNGNLTFTDVTAAAGMTFSGASGATAWSDYDGDGWLDLYLTVRTGANGDPTHNRLYRNLGNGTFVDIGATLGVDAGVDPTLLPAFFDFDRDGDDDLYLGTDKGSAGVWKNRLYRNDGGAFTEITTSAAAAAYVDCMGIAIADLNFDGFFDLYLTNIQVGNKLLMHNGQDAFVDQTAAAGVASFAYGWGTVFADFNDDTHPDLYVCNLQSNNRLYEGSATWPLSDVASQAGVATPNTSYCVSVGDVDNDGDLDMLVGETNTRVKLYINNTVNANHAARFRVVGQGHNTQAIGAQLDLEVGGVWQAFEVRAGHNFKAMNELTVHAGLGTATAADTVVVRWPGTGDTRTLSGAPADVQWTVYPPEALGDVNRDGRLTRTDLFALLTRLRDGAAPIAPGEEVMDMDGDFDVDAEDAILLAARVRPITLPTGP